MLIDRQMLLGIGVGLLLAATLSAAGGHRSARLSDVEVMRRAKELGMSFQGEQRLAIPETPAPAAAPAPSAKPVAAAQPVAPASQRDPGSAPAAAGRPQQTKPAPVTQPRGDVTVSVPQGASAGYVARLLAEKSLIADQTEFLKLAGERNVGTRFQPGTYRFPSDIRVRDLVSALLAGPKPQ